MFRHQLQTRIEIGAAADRVWAILMDFAAYPDWNPFIHSLKGQPAVGQRLEAVLQPNGKQPMTFRPVVERCEPGREFRWRGHLLVPGLFDGEHRFAIEPLPGGRCLFHHDESFRGLLVPVLRGSLDRDTRSGFEAMNQALKQRAESGPPAP
jgi:hypothetical protein